jgi:hypothetical protein
VVPDSFTAFFAATAGVAGALIGLLFVALSVALPMADPERRAELDVKAGITFSVFVNALAISLFALVPGLNLGVTAVVVGLLGLSSCLAFGIILWRETSDRRARFGQLRHLVLQAAVFAYQVVVGVQLSRHSAEASDVQSLAIVTIVLFLVGIVRAWQLIGARESSLVGILATSLRDRATTPSGDAEPT